MIDAANVAETTETADANQDQYAGSLPDRLDPAVVRELSQLSPAISMLRIAAEWLAIGTAAALCSRWFSPWLYVVTVAFIGARQHGLLVLAHDGAHYRILRNRTLNDWVSEVFLAWPFVLVTMQAYRRNHFPHHRFVNTGQDPDWIRKQTAEWRFPKRPLELAALLASDAIGLGFIKFALVASRLPKEPRSASGAERERAFGIARRAFLVTLAVLLTVLHGWWAFFAYWVVPYLTWMQLCFHVRSIAEHFGIQGRHGGYAQTRTVVASLFDRMFLVPNHVSYHVEHHLYPSVPFYRLPELHRRLMELPRYRDSVHVTHGYFRVLRECCTPANRPPEETNAPS